MTATASPIRTFPSLASLYVMYPAITRAQAEEAITAGIIAAEQAGMPYEADTTAYARRDLASGTAPGLVALRFAEGFYGK